MTDELKSCGHPGCLSHVTHPCGGCGRMMGMTWEEAYQFIMNDLKQKYSHAFLRWVFPPAGMGILDNFGFALTLGNEEKDDKV